MMQPPAINLGVELVVLLEDPSSGAGTVIPRQVIGAATDETAIRSLASQVDVVTVDHEVLDLDLVTRLQSEGIVLRPDAATLAVAADKLAQKRQLLGAGFPLVEFEELDSMRRFREATERWGGTVVKAARGGYDGRGVWMNPTPETVEGLLDRGLSPLLAERPMERIVEVAAVVARRPSGEMAVYDPVETIQIDGMCRAVLAPARLPVTLLDKARRLAEEVVSELETVGVTAIEMFVVDDRVLVNEVAPRPHNSGHHTIDAALTSQFENHLRAVLDWPLGDPGLRSRAATVNLVGTTTGTDPRETIEFGLATDGSAKIHLYDKTPRPERKIGHVTVCHDDVELALKRAWKVAEAMGCEVRR